MVHSQIIFYLMRDRRPEASFGDPLDDRAAGRAPLNGFRGSLYSYVCIYVYVRICAYLFLYVCINTHRYICIGICVYMHVYLQI